VASQHQDRLILTNAIHLYPVDGHPSLRGWPAQHEWSLGSLVLNIIVAILLPSHSQKFPLPGNNDFGCSKGLDDSKGTIALTCQPRQAQSGADGITAFFSCGKTDATINMYSVQPRFLWDPSFHDGIYINA